MSIFRRVATNSSNIVQWFLAKYQITQLRQPPHRPDIAPQDFWLFLNRKIPLKRHRFDDADAIEKKTMSALMAIPKTDFPNGSKIWR